MSVSAEMPRYRCHKTVHALKIASITKEKDEVHAKLTFDDPGYEPVIVALSRLVSFTTLEANEHGRPTRLEERWIVPGDYYVVYADGYQSFSPRQAFEEGYTRL